MAAYQAQYQQQQQKHHYARPSYTNYPPSQHPPFQGPPPIPAGVSVNPQQWQAGYWQYNPAYNQNRNPHQQHVPWIPGQSWIQQQQQLQQPQSSASQQQQPPQQQQQQQASYNPYKRVPRPPSAEYLATKLSENPLGLFGMEDKNPNYDHVQTPWVWQPRSLDEADDESPSRKNTDPEPSPVGSRRNSDTPVPASTEPPESFTARRELQPTFSINIVRTPDHYRRSSSGSTDTSSPSRSSTRGSRSSVDSGLSSQMTSMSISSDSSTPSRRSSLPTTMSSASSTKPDYPIAPMLAESLSDEPDSMLSPLIIAQTPKTTPMRGLRANATYPVIPAALAPIPETSNPSERTSRNQRPHAAASLPALKSHGSLTYNGPSAPLPNHPTQPLPRRESYEADRLGSRHTTFIDPHISTNTNTFKSTRVPSPPRTPSPRHPPSRSSSRHSSRPSSTHASPTYPTSSHITPPTGYPISPRPSPPYHGSSKYTPPEGHKSTASTSTITPNTYGSSSSVNVVVPKMSNPLPPPPHLVQSTRQPFVPTQLPAPPAYHEKLRRGYWNRRGDHLTLDGYLVFAPHDKAFPNELRNYPAEDEGYQDQDGTFAAWVNRPELPQSLPRMGNPPEIPYEKFVVYEYR